MIRAALLEELNSGRISDRETSTLARCAARNAKHLLPMLASKLFKGGACGSCFEGSIVTKHAHISKSPQFFAEDSLSSWSLCATSCGRLLEALLEAARNPNRQTLKGKSFAKRVAGRVNFVFVSLSCE